MKTRKIVTILSLLVGVTVLCAWDAPDTQDIRANRGNLNLRNSNNEPNDANEKVGASHSNLIAGYANKAGFGNTWPSTTDDVTTYRSILVGSGNQAGGNNNILVGNDNMVRGSTTTAYAHNSTAIGLSNHVFAASGWVIGSSSEVTANKATAIGNTAKAGGDSAVAIGYTAEASGTSAVSAGVGTNATVNQSTALGRYNATMTSNTVLDIGSGTSTARFTALRVTNDGGVVLGRAQGDISMGNYQ